MITIDQLRISDDGKLMYIDAHVNKASYFKNVYVDSITILTEEQVSETNPYTFSGDYIYQNKLDSTELVYSEAESEVQVLSADRLIDKELRDGGFQIEVPKGASNERAVSFMLSGKFSELGTGDKKPVIVLTNADYNPETEGLTGTNVIAVFNGNLYKTDKVTEPVWQFNGKTDTGLENSLKFYIYKTNEDDSHTLVRLDQTDDKNFLHFYYRTYYQVGALQKKDIHLVLCPQNMNEKFKGTDFSKNMFFVYFTVTGTPTADTPCRMDETTTLGVTFDYGLIYDNAMCYTKELSNSCDVPQGFTDFLLHVAALKLAIETEHYVDAINQYKYIIQNGCTGNTGITVKHCGCNS